MPNYSHGKIYKIVGDTGATYYGSTVRSLRERMGKHRTDKRTSAYREIISQMDCEIILVENYPCDSKKELEDREAWYIRENPCVNQCIPGRTQKEYREDKRDHRKVILKKYREDHREEAREYNKQYHADHREELLANMSVKNKWRHSFGDSRYTNCLQRCDPSLFA